MPAARKSQKHFCFSLNQKTGLISMLTNALHSFGRRRNRKKDGGSKKSDAQRGEKQVKSDFTICKCSLRSSHTVNHDFR